MKPLATLSLILLIARSTLFSADGTVKGRVVDEETSDPLLGVNVVLQGTLRGTTTNASGEFRLDNLGVDSGVLSFSLVGYQRGSAPFILSESNPTAELTVHLSPVAIQTAPVVVTAGKREQSLEEVPVSVSVMDAATIAYRNSITIDDALRYVPGVNITETQVNIRGSSGYNRGVGSRVLLLVDGIPFLTGDTGEINFETIPIGEVDRIEVVKGASSALYGSSALGGVINIITKPIGEEPMTKFRTYGGFYTTPSFTKWDWSNRTRFLNGFSLTHSQKVDRLGFMVYGSRIFDDGFRLNDWKWRYNGYAKMRYDFTSANDLTVAFNIMNQRHGSYLYWRNLDSALVPPADQIGNFIESTRSSLSGVYHQVISNDLFYVVRTMWFRNKFESLVTDERDLSRSDVLRGEVQASWAATGNQILTFGVDGSLDRVRADLFGDRSGNGAAVYVQDEIALFDNLHATVGARFDYASIDSLRSSSQLNPKLGIAWSPVPGTDLRGSFGTGFRTPTVGEAFLRTEAAGFPIIPNPGLRPEKSYSYEIGGSQVLTDNALLDVALFQTDFSNLIESGFVSTAGQTVVGQFNNVTKARIQGIESSLKLGFFNRALFVDLSYTFLSPRNLTKGETLRYRPKHLFYASARARAGMFDFGVDFRYLSRIEQIDQEFVDFGIINDGDARVAIYVTDVRVGVDFSSLNFPLSAALIVKNLFQYNYVEIIGNIAGQRNIVLMVQARL